MWRRRRWWWSSLGWALVALELTARVTGIIMISRRMLIGCGFMVSKEIWMGTRARRPTNDMLDRVTRVQAIQNGVS